MSNTQLTEESFQMTARKSCSGRKSIASKRVNDENDPDGLYTQLLTLKTDRLKADEEAKMLKNRIGLLLQEEQRAQKKIEETKRKAKSILELKLQNQQHLILKEEAKLQRMKMEHEQFLRNKQLRSTLIESKTQAVHSYQKKSVERAHKVRQELQGRKEMSKSMTDLAIKKNMVKASKVKSQQHQAVLRKIQNVEKKISESRNYYDNRIKVEAVTKTKRTDEIVQLEKIELELIRKLQNTRREQLSHMEQLDKLKNTKFGFSNINEPKEENAEPATLETSQSFRARSMSADRSDKY